MREVFGDLWKFDGIIAITTNGFVRTDRTCVMGRGCARQAAVRFPELPRKLASRISAEGNHVFYFSEYRLITFPVKHNWWEAADLDLIQRSARELLKIIEVKKIKEAVYLPRPGCGNGRLKWEDVKKILSPILTGDQFPYRDLRLSSGRSLLQNRFIETTIQPSILRSPPRRPRADSK